MKLSVSLPEDDVEFLDAYARAQGITSRSAVVHKAVRLLKACWAPRWMSMAVSRSLEMV